MQNVFYSIIGLLALVIHVVLNTNQFKISDSDLPTVDNHYRLFLISVFFYYAVDSLWGIISLSSNVPLLYIDTFFCYIAMMFSLVCWFRYVLSYLKLEDIYVKIIMSVCITYLLFGSTLLLINNFKPLLFWYDAAGNYEVSTLRYVLLIIQIFLLVAISVVAFVKSIKSRGLVKRRNTAIVLFGFAMGMAIIGQLFYPVMPIYTIGLLIGTTVINVYVLESEKDEYRDILKTNDEILSKANMGIWYITLIDGEQPRMKANPKMRELLSLPDDVTDETEIYNAWYSRIKPDALPSVEESLEAMKSDGRNENTYLWIDPKLGEQYVRCGGVAERIGNKGWSIRGYHYNVNEAVLHDQQREIELEKTLSVVNEQYSVLKSMSGIYYSVHLIDLKNDTVKEIRAQNEVKEMVNKDRGIIDLMNNTIRYNTVDKYVNRALKFTDLTTLPDRMKNKMIISSEFLGKHLGWFRAQFISIEQDAEGRPTKVVFSTQGIDEEKKQRDLLIKMSKTDELTGFYNRRAYEESIVRYKDNPIEDTFVYLSFDVNGLKKVNDTLGHVAGDELLIGACSCMKEAFGNFGKLYRTGGDEFVCIALISDVQLRDALRVFEDKTKNWTGTLVKNLSVSCGIVTKFDNPNSTIDEIAIIADQRMYASKKNYYDKKGIDRRKG